MRNLKTLLDITIEKWEEGGLYTKWGLCNCTNQLYRNYLITLIEKDTLDNFLEKNRPTKKKHSKFFDDTCEMCSYWWNIDNKEVRLMFLYSVTLNLK